jgi:hypothetical protein
MDSDEPRWAVAEDAGISAEALAKLLWAETSAVRSAPLTGT